MTSGVVTYHNSRAAAFTLVELMVVVVLIAVVTAMVIPEMKGTYEDALLRSTGRKLSDASRLASSRAVALQQLHRLRIDRANNRYLVERAASGGLTKFQALTDVAGAEGILDERIKVELRPAASLSRNLDEPDAEPDALGVEPASVATEVISFNADGTADSAEIVLQDRQGFGLVLRINPTTARVQIVQVEHQ